MLYEMYNMAFAVAPPGDRQRVHGQVAKLSAALRPRRS
jgi:hypothetical protein